MFRLSLDLGCRIEEGLRTCVVSPPPRKTNMFAIKVSSDLQWVFWGNSGETGQGPQH